MFRSVMRYLSTTLRTVKRALRTPAKLVLSMTVLKVIAGVTTGIALGLGVFTARYAGALSYLSNDPKACANCHIMQAQYDGWQKASHHTVATCVDCHLPHALLPKYIAKAENGYHHSMAFTRQDFAEPIRIKDANIERLQANCLRCHGELVHPLISTGSGTDRDQSGDRTVSCMHCHASVGHGEMAGLGGSRQ